MCFSGDNNTDYIKIYSCYYQWKISKYSKYYIVSDWDKQNKNYDKVFHYDTNTYKFKYVKKQDYCARYALFTDVKFRNNVTFCAPMGPEDVISNKITLNYLLLDTYCNNFLILDKNIKPSCLITSNARNLISSSKLTGSNITEEKLREYQFTDILLELSKKSNIEKP
jgi:hypothetical protein